MELTVAACQMECVLENKAANFAIAQKMVEEAAQKGAKLIVLPELFNTGYRVEENDRALSEPIPGPTTDFLLSFCQKFQLFIIANIIEKDLTNQELYNTAFMVSPQGKISIYRKINLYGQEQIRFSPGTELEAWDMNDIKVGCQICYDVGFPEPARILTLQGAKILTYPSAFHSIRRYAWDLATRARALENGLYLIAANRYGAEKENIFAATSRIVDPQGRVIKEATYGNEVIMATIDLDFIEKQRDNIPYLKELKYKTSLA